MPQVVNTNIASLNAQRNLNRSQGQLATSLQRISSGLRVNSAKDDAAGLAISNRLTAQVRGFNQGARNAADAVSLAQTGEGALSEVTNNLQRMRELAIQSRNATNTDADRQSLDLEFQQLLAENDRIAEQTSFNGRKILDGTMGSAAFQIGANVGETISVDVSSSVRNNAVGNVATQDLSFITSGPTSTGLNFAALTVDDISLTGTDLTINGAAIGAATDAANGLGDGSANQIATAINGQLNATGVTATANAATLTITAANFGSALNFTDVIGVDDTLSFELQINGTSALTEIEGASTIASQSDLITSINGVAKTTGVVATLQSNGDILLTAQDGRNIEFAEQISASTSGDADSVTGFLGNAITATGAVSAAVSTTAKGTVSLSSTRDIAIVDTGADNFFADSTTSASTIDQSNVLSTTSSDAAVLRIDQALTDIDALRGTFGAVQSRFESTIRNLQTASENASAANSRILDADFAQETANLTRAQILQQAGVSILAQANTLPQSALALLQ
ncbi:MAG: flagellin [Gammaproteobacteria bacterium]|jgi:flagellin